MKIYSRLLSLTQTHTHVTPEAGDDDKEGEKDGGKGGVQAEEDVVVGGGRAFRVIEGGSAAGTKGVEPTTHATQKKKLELTNEQAQVLRRIASHNNFFIRCSSAQNFVNSCERGCFFIVFFTIIVHWERPQKR